MTPQNPTAESDFAAMIGITIGDTYKILSHLGSGGMGSVFLARHQRTGGEVALKLIRAGRLGDTKTLERFELEAKLTASLHHPHIVRIYDYGHDSDLVYIAMEYVPADTLEALIVRDAKLDWELAAEIARQTLMALSAAHTSEHKLIHRDIKPANILVSVDDNDETYVRVVDFGIAKALAGDGTETEGLVGSPQTMAPELFDDGIPSVQSDLYALGCTMYAMLAGRPPFTGTLSQLALKHSNQTPTPLAELTSDVVPTAILEWVDHMMSKAPSQRPESADAALELLNAACVPSEGHALSGRKPVREKGGSNARYLWTFAAVVVLGGALVWSQQTQTDVPEPPTIVEQPKPEAASTRPVGVKHSPSKLGKGNLNPDGTRLVHARGNSLEIIELDTQHISTFALTPDSKAVSAAWMPGEESFLTVEIEGDSKTFRQTGNGGVIWRNDADGTRARLIENAFGPSVSPDGKQLLYKTGMGVEHGLWIANIDGSDATQVATNAIFSHGWLSDGSGVVYCTQASQKLAETSFYIVNKNRSRLVSTKGAGATAGGVPFAPMSGNRIIFKRASDPTAFSPSSNLWSMKIGKDFEPSDYKQLTFTKGFDYKITSWSENGETILYRRFRVHEDIRTARYHDDGTLEAPATTIASTLGVESPSSLSEDGQRLLFHSDRGGDLQVFEYDFESEKTTQLTFHEHASAFATHVRGTSEILFWRTNMAGKRIGESQLYVTNDGDERLVLEQKFGKHELESSFAYPIFNAATCTRSECLMIDRGPRATRVFAFGLTEPKLEPVVSLPTPEGGYKRWDVRDQEPRIALASPKGFQLLSLKDKKITKTFEFNTLDRPYSLAWSTHDNGWFGGSGYDLLFYSLDGKSRVTHNERAFVNPVLTSPRINRLVWGERVISTAPWVAHIPKVH